MITWLTLVLIVGAFTAGARSGYTAGRHEPPPPCALCAARAAQAAEVAELTALYDAPAYGDD